MPNSTKTSKVFLHVERYRLDADGLTYLIAVSKIKPQSSMRVYQQRCLTLRKITACGIFEATAFAKKWFGIREDMYS